MFVLFQEATSGANNEIIMTKHTSVDELISVEISKTEVTKVESIISKIQIMITNNKNRYEYWNFVEKQS